jgi:hypothetical protein
MRGDYVRIPADDFRKAKSACEAFACSPYSAILVDEADAIRVFVTSMENLHRLSPPSERSSGWRMGKKAVSCYHVDPDVKLFEFTSKTHSWWQPESG